MPNTKEQEASKITQRCFNLKLLEAIAKALKMFSLIHSVGAWTSEQIEKKVKLLVTQVNERN